MIGQPNEISHSNWDFLTADPATVKVIDARNRLAALTCPVPKNESEVQLKAEFEKYQHIKAEIGRLRLELKTSERAVLCAAKKLANEFDDDQVLGKRLDALTSTRKAIRWANAGRLASRAGILEFNEQSERAQLRRELEREQIALKRRIEQAESLTTAETEQIRKEVEEEETEDLKSAFEDCAMPAMPAMAAAWRVFADPALDETGILQKKYLALARTARHFPSKPKIEREIMGHTMEAVIDLNDFHVADDIKRNESERILPHLLSILESFARHSSAAEATLSRIRGARTAKTPVRIRISGELVLGGNEVTGLQTEVPWATSSDTRKAARLQLTQMSETEYYDLMNFMIKQISDKEGDRLLAELDREERNLGAQVVAAFGDTSFAYTRLLKANFRGKTVDAENLRHVLGDEWVTEMLRKYERDTGIGTRRYNGK